MRPSLALATLALLVVPRCGAGSPAPEAPVRFVTASLPAALTGPAYEASLQAVVPHPPAVFRLVGGRLPAGLDLDGDAGLLAGHPRAVGSFRFTVEVRDGLDPRLGRDATVAAAVATFDLEVGRGPVTILPVDVRPMQFRVPFEHRFDVAGGEAPYRFALVGGTVPPGMGLSEAGVLRGVPGEPCEPRDVVVRATDARGETVERAFSVRVVVPPLRFFGDPPPPAAVGAPYSHEFRLFPAGGGPPHSFSLVGASPPGLALERNGVLSGVPATVGAFDLEVKATDAAGQVASRQASLVVNPGPTLTRIDPPAYRPGNPEVVVTGHDFRAGLTVRFGAADPVEALVETPTAARVVPPLDPSQHGPVTVVLRNPDGGTSAWKAAFRYPLETVAFAHAGVFGTARGKSRGLAAGDLDGDGRADLVHVGGSGIEVLRSRDRSGGLGFDTVLVRSDGSFNDVGLADVDADGDLDVVASRSSTAESIECYLNDGRGVFPSTASRTTGYAKPPNLHNPHSLAVGDCDGDGVPDVAFTSTRGSQGMAWLYRGLGDGSFDLVRVVADVRTGSQGLYAPTGVVLADLDGDGKDDVCLADEIPAACTTGHSCPDTPATNVYPGARGFAAWCALSGEGGSLGSWHPADVGPGHVLDGCNESLVAYDHDGDGMLDLAVLGGFRDERGMGVAFLRGDGRGGFQPRHVESTRYARRFGARIDANRDACDDLVVAEAASPPAAGRRASRTCRAARSPARTPAAWPWPTSTATASRTSP